MTDDSTKKPFRAGDHVAHGPTEETWILACDETAGSVIPMGWPETRAEAKDCTILRAATDEERLDVLREVAKRPRDPSSSYRTSLAQHQLAKADDAYARERATAELDQIASNVEHAATRIAALRARHGRDFVRDRPHGDLLDTIDAHARRSRA